MEFCCISFFINFPGGECFLDISEDILRQSVVMSADVIEHIVDPYYCYLPLLSHLAQYAHAVVVSTPDRERISECFLLSISTLDSGHLLLGDG